MLLRGGHNKVGGLRLSAAYVSYLEEFSPIRHTRTMNFIKDLSVDKVLNLAEDTFNQVKPKSDVEARVYEVLSHKNWGSSSTILNQVAQDTYDYDKCEWLWESYIETAQNNGRCSCVIWFVSGRDAVAISLRFVRSLHIIRHYCMYPTRLRVRVRAPPPHGHYIRSLQQLVGFTRPYMHVSYQI